MFVYKEKWAVERIWKTQKDRIKGVAQSIYYKRALYNVGYTFEDFFANVQRIFFANFYQYYEEDEQYARFMQTCILNHAKSFLAKEYRRGKYIINDPAHIVQESGLAIKSEQITYEQVWNNLGNNTCLQKYEALDLVCAVEKKLSEQSKKILALLLEGLTAREISKALALSPRRYTYHFGRIKETFNELLKV